MIVSNQSLTRGKMRPRKVSDQEVFDVVRKCLIEHGGSVSTQYIADCIGVSQATLFKRFGSKNNLLQTALLVLAQTKKAKDVFEILDKGPTDEPIQNQLKNLCLRMRIVSHLIFFNFLKRTEGGATVDFIVTLFIKQNIIIILHRATS